METPTPFDLNQAIAQWRCELQSSPAVGSESGDEIEAHLRESVSNLKRQSLSAEEAFLIATKRFGQAGAIQAEFHKVNYPAVWIDRGLWTLIGVQVWLAISSLSGSAFALFIHRNSMSGTLTWIISMVIHFLPVVALLGFVGWVLPKLMAKSETPMSFLLARPALLLALLIAVGFVCHLCSVIIMQKTVLGDSSFTWLGYALQLSFAASSKLVLAVATFVLARKRITQPA